MEDNCRLLSLLGICCLIAGCASYASRQYACQDVFNRGSLYAYPYLWVGNTLQIGDCAISEKMRVELGDYYQTHKISIDRVVKDESKRALGGPEELHKFGKALKCKSESLPAFSELIFKYKDELFGEEFDKSPRAVTLNIVEKIQKDPTLKDMCR